MGVSTSAQRPKDQVCGGSRPGGAQAGLRHRGVLSGEDQDVSEAGILAAWG